jgi:alcohol dehydrogenase class IV
MTIHRFAFPTTISFGPGARKEVAAHLKAQGVKRPLIVTDRGIAPLPMLKSFIADLPGLDVAVFSDIWGNPVASQAMRGAVAFKDHHADAVIGLGGGAALDVAKTVALLATHDGDVLEYAWDHPQVRAIEHSLPYFVALPTTSGRGSEVGRSSVVSDDATHIKKIIFSPKLLARAVFADPELTLDLPPHITAATGMDALTHNVESYLSPAYHPLCDGIALEGTRIAARSLRVAVREPHNLVARSDMMMSSMMGAIAFQKDLGAVHSCAHALDRGGSAHGLANGIMIDHVSASTRRPQPTRWRSWRMGSASVGVEGGCRARIRRLAGRAEARTGDSADTHGLSSEAGGDACRHSGAGRGCRQRQLPPDQPATVHKGGFRAHFRRSDLSRRRYLVVPCPC